jgi:hypothetical protein
MIPSHGKEAMRAILQASVGDSISRSAALIAVRVVSLAILAESLHWKEANHALKIAANNNGCVVIYLF